MLSLSLLEKRVDSVWPSLSLSSQQHSMYFILDRRGRNWIEKMASRTSALAMILLLLVGLLTFLAEGFSVKDATFKSHLEGMHVVPPVSTRWCATHTKDNVSSRRAWLSKVTKAATASSSSMLFWNTFLAVPSAANASEEESDFFDDPEIKEMYENPNIPQAPEERSGLVVLRVAEVAEFQEKILRAIASGELTGVMVSPMQFLFGTQILLRNSNLDGNMKLMIQEEIPKRRRTQARQSAANAMNQLQEIAKFAGSIQRDFETIEMVQLADMYRNVRVNLNQLYEYLPEKEQEKYDGYFVAVTAYEKKIAEGTYNPDIDGILKFDDK